jgi:hypothetical protein
MVRVLAARWPAGADAGEALGYVLARHVPLQHLPDGLALIREAAGLPVASAADPACGVSGLNVGRWLEDARAHAARLGALGDLERLVCLLGDGRLRSRDAARELLEAAGAGDLGDPQVVTDFAVWCGMELPYTQVRLGARGGRRAAAYVADPRALALARELARARLRPGGIVAACRLLDQINAAGVQVEVGGSPAGVHELLGVAGGGGWVWARTDGVSVLGCAMRRIAALDRAIPLQTIPRAVARSASRRRPDVPGEWPLPVDGVRAWAGAHPGWVVHDSQVRPRRAPRQVKPRDQRVIDAFTDRRTLTWKQLRDRRVAGGGFSIDDAAAAIHFSPLLHRGADGYTLLGD